MTPFGWLFVIAGVVIAALVATAILLTVSRRRLVVKLATLRRRFFECMDAAPFCAYIKDSEGRYIYENTAFLECTRQALPDSASFLGRTDLECFPAAQAQRYMNDDQEVLRRRKTLVFENSSVDADGSVRLWSSLKFPWADEDGRDCIAGVSFELTEMRRAQRAVQASEDRCALALEAGRMGTLTLDLHTQQLETSPLFAVLHGRPETKTRLSLQESLAEVHPDDRQSIIDAVQAAFRDRAPSRITYRVVRPDGVIAWLELMGQVSCDETGRPAIVRGVGFDVTEAKAAYEELARRKKILRRLIEVQENERQMLCHELHDGMMQYAIAAKMHLEGIRNAAESASSGEQIDTVLDCLNRGIAEGRQVIRGVRSAVLDDLGLCAAIRDLADQMAVLGITVEINPDEDLDTLPPDLRTTVYRVVQESLNNVRKHASTDWAQVAIHRTPIEVHVRVSDRGCGFIADDARRRGFGIVGMTERVRLAGGTFTIETRPGAGTHVDICLPVLATAGSMPAVTGEGPVDAAAVLRADAAAAP
jgi:PAS domain S-box-containing protein